MSGHGGTPYMIASKLKFNSEENIQMLTKLEEIYSIQYINLHIHPVFKFHHTLIQKTLLKKNTTEQPQFIRWQNEKSHYTNIADLKHSN